MPFTKKQQHSRRHVACTVGPIVAVVAALAIFAWPMTASPEGRIVIHGPPASAHLRLQVDHGNIVVLGYLGFQDQTGCSTERGGATCPLDGVGSMEIQMGPNNDKIEVLDRLPIPLTVHLGGGSDKFIGNGEPDTCYPEGAKRNRCIGGGGDDICITGNRNSDCVGDGGDDYCRTGSGSDGCWGGAGDDICIMGSGHDGCHGDSGNDRLLGGPDSDQLYGGSGRDFCDGGPGVGRSHTCETGPGG